MIKFVKKTIAKIRCQLGRIRRTIRRLLQNLDLSLAIEIAIPPVFKLKVEIQRQSK